MGFVSSNGLYSCRGRGVITKEQNTNVADTLVGL